MFKRSRQKIVASIMGILALLLLGTLAVIYLSSYFEMKYDNLQMLQDHARSYTFRVGESGSLPQPLQPPLKPFEQKPAFRLSTFYTVVLDNDGRVIFTDTGTQQLYDEQTLQEYAQKIAKGRREYGVKGSLLYLVSDRGSYTLVTFMDNTVVQERMESLLRNTLVFGGVTTVLMFFFARYLAKRIVSPLEESYRKQKQFISDAGHELKTPISVINTNADMLRRETGESQWLSNIQYENERMGLLVRQLLELARTENVAPQMQQVELSRLVAGETLPFESVAFEKGLNLRVQIAPALMILGDGAQLKQLVAILVDNAIDHSVPGGEVLVRLCAEHNHAKLSVINDGPQIPKEQQERIFERFYRADEARSDDGHFGLGLAIARSITQAHKGKLAVECYDGKVEFRATLPLMRA